MLGEVRRKLTGEGQPLLNMIGAEGRGDPLEQPSGTKNSRLLSLTVTRGWAPNRPTGEDTAGRGCVRRFGPHINIAGLKVPG